MSLPDQIPLPLKRALEAKGYAELTPVQSAMLEPDTAGADLLVSAQTGSGKRDTGTLHRIDPELVKTEAVAAGFQYVGESNALRNPADQKDKGVREVPRGKSDQFVYKFRRPM